MLVSFLGKKTHRWLWLVRSSFPKFTYTVTSFPGEDVVWLEPDSTCPSCWHEAPSQVSGWAGGTGEEGKVPVRVLSAPCNSHWGAAPGRLCSGWVPKGLDCQSRSEKVACWLSSASVARERNPGASEWGCWLSTLFSFLCTRRSIFRERHGSSLSQDSFLCKENNIWSGSINNNCEGIYSGVEWTPRSAVPAGRPVLGVAWRTSLRPSGGGLRTSRMEVN